MKRRMLYSTLIVLVALASIGGATLAWFTATATISDNSFTAGTLSINADEINWTGDVGAMLNNWNPGDCGEKEITIENDGSKTAYLKMNSLFTGAWYLEDGVTLFDAANVSPSVITITISDPNWEKVTLTPSGIDIYLYKGNDGIIPGTYGGVSPSSVTVKVNVCLSGSDTTNAYMGKTFKLTAITFDAIQTTHEAVFDVWGVAYIKDNTNGVDGWYQVEFVGGTWTTINEIGTVPAYYEWDGEAWNK